MRAFANHQRWSEAEITLLQACYITTPRHHLAALFAGRHIRAIECKANALGLEREKTPARSAEETLKAKREGMARLRERDREAARRKRNAYHAKNREAQTAKMRAYYAKRFFWGKAMKLRGEGHATAKDLAVIWKRQRGRCALTGRRLDRSAQLDHVLAKARGGTDDASNLRWLCKIANLARRELSDEEFLLLCSDTMRWLGERIDAVNALAVA